MRHIVPGPRQTTDRTRDHPSRDEYDTPDPGNQYYSRFGHIHLWDRFDTTRRMAHPRLNDDLSHRSHGHIVDLAGDHVGSKYFVLIPTILTISDPLIDVVKGLSHIAQHIVR